jgi:hypothetical protein
MTTTHKDYVEAIKNSAIAAAKKQLALALIKKVPYLFWGPLGPIMDFAIEQVVTILINETEFAIYFKYIDMRVDAQGRAFSEAAIKNLEAQKSGDPVAIAQAEKELMEKFKAFVVLGS